MLDVSSNFQLTPASRYHVSLAVDDSEIREAQRLRYKVFADEMGARLSSILPGHDIDLYDPFCDHLLVRELGSGEVVGTYRILPPEAASASAAITRTGIRPHPLNFCARAWPSSDVRACTRRIAAVASSPGCGWGWPIHDALRL
jgi:predicted GNAT family N-acyltransferase